MVELLRRSNDERPGRPCQFAALSGRRAAQDGQGTMPGGPERAGMEGLGEALSAGRAAAPGSRVGAEGRGRSADRVAHELAERAKPGGSCGHGEAARASARARPFQAMARAVFVAVAAVGLLVGPTFAAEAPIPVKPGDVVSVPWPIKNADAQGNPGGDTISSLKVIVTGDAAFVTNAVASADESLAPGAVKTFTPKFTVGPNAVDGQTYTVTLKVISPDEGIYPDPDDPAGDTSVLFRRSGRLSVLDRLG